MHWSNLQTHYKSIVSLILICSIPLVPILVFMSPLSSWMSSLSTGNTDTPIFLLFTLLNFPLFYTALTRQSNPPLVNRIYLFLYFLLSAIVFYTNPLNVFDTPFTFYFMGGLTATLFVILKYLIEGVLQHILMVILIIALGVCGENVWSQSPDHITYYMIAYTLGYLWNMFTTDLTTLFLNLLGMILTIPALLIKWFRGNRASTPSVPSVAVKSNPIPYAVILVEIALIVLYFYVRTWAKRINGGKIIVHNPIDLDKITSYKVPDRAQYNYTLTFWLYLDSVSPGFSQSASEFTDVVLYGDNVLIAYNAALNTLRVIMKNGERKQSYDILHVPLQKWNQVGLLYSNGTFDIFMNGELQKSIVAVPQPSNHEVLVGFERGVQGQLCTLMFYDKVLTMDQLSRLYTQFKDKNPPTV